MDLTFGVNSDTILLTTSGHKILEQMRREPANVRFNDLYRVCETHFGALVSPGPVMRFLRRHGRETLE